MHLILQSEKAVEASFAHSGNITYVLDQSQGTNQLVVPMQTHKKQYKLI